MTITMKLCMEAGRCSEAGIPLRRNGPAGVLRRLVGGERERSVQEKAVKWAELWWRIG